MIPESSTLLFLDHPVTRTYFISVKQGWNSFIKMKKLYIPMYWAKIVDPLTQGFVAEFLRY